MVLLGHCLPAACPFPELCQQSPVREDKLDVPDGHFGWFGQKLHVLKSFFSVIILLFVQTKYVAYTFVFFFCKITVKLLWYDIILK